MSLQRSSVNAKNFEIFFRSLCFCLWPLRFQDPVHLRKSDESRECVEHFTVKLYKMSNHVNSSPVFPGRVRFWCHKSGKKRSQGAIVILATAAPARYRARSRCHCRGRPWEQLVIGGLDCFSAQQFWATVRTWIWILSCRFGSRKETASPNKTLDKKVKKEQ